MRVTRVSRYGVTLSRSELGDSRFLSLPPFTTRYYFAMPPKGSGKEKAAIEEEDEILQAVILADSFNSRFGPLTMELPRVCIHRYHSCRRKLIQMPVFIVPSSGMQYSAAGLDVRSISECWSTASLCVLLLTCWIDSASNQVSDSPFLDSTGNKSLIICSL